MSFVDGRVIRQRMAKKDARMAKRAKVRSENIGEGGRIDGAERARQRTTSAPEPAIGSAQRRRVTS